MKTECVSIHGVSEGLRRAFRDQCSRLGITYSNGCNDAINELLNVLDANQAVFESPKLQSKKWNVRVSKSTMANVREALETLKIKQSPFIVAAMKLWSSASCHRPSVDSSQQAALSEALASHIPAAPAPVSSIELESPPSAEHEK